MKIAYISRAAYSDVDISFMQKAQKTMDITYILVVGSGECMCAIDLRESTLKAGINEAKDIPQLSKFSEIIDFDRFLVFYIPGNHAYSVGSLRGNHMLYKHLVKCKYDIVHITFFPSFLNPYFFKLRRKLILTVHDPIPHSSGNYKMDNVNRKFSLKYIRYYLLLNKTQVPDFIKYYNLNEKKVSIFNSILSCYSYLRMYSLNVSKTTPYVLYFGNIRSYKGVDYLLRAMVKVHEKCPDLMLVVAGSGKFYFDIEQFKKLDYIDIRNRFIPDNELAELIKGCEFVVVPYIDATQSGVIMSAYAFDKPCVVTNVGGLPEMVDNGNLGIIVQPKDEGQLADAIKKLHDSPDLLCQYSLRIHQEYEDGPKSWTSVSQNIYGIYQSILEK